MLIIIGIYLTLYAALFALDGAIRLVALATKKVIYYSALSMYIRGLEYLMGIFLISIMALGISLTGVITEGFVAGITTILAIFAIAYVVELIYNRYKYRGYIMVLPTLSKRQIKELPQIITLMGDSYITPDDMATINRKYDNSSIEQLDHTPTKNKEQIGRAGVEDMVDRSSSESSAPANNTGSDVGGTIIDGLQHEIADEITHRLPDEEGLKARKKSAMAMFAVSGAMIITLIFIIISAGL